MILVAVAIVGGFLAFIITFYGRERKRFMESVEGKHVLITGGSSGIGFAIAKRCVQEGAYVSLLARNEANLTKARDSLLNFCGGDSGRILTRSADVKDGERLRNAIQECCEWRPIDILICNAAVVKACFFEEMSMEDMETIGRTNVLGTYYTVYAGLPSLKARSRTNPCALVFVNSLSALTVLPMMNLYASTKLAQKGLAELLRLELLPYNIRVCNVFAAFTDTPFFHEGDEFASTSKTLSNIWGFISERMLQKPEEVAEATIEGVKRGEFLITTTWDGFMNGVLARGNVPAESVSRALLELLLLVPVRIASFIIFHFGKRVVKKMHDEHYSYKAST